MPHSGCSALHGVNPNFKKKLHSTNKQNNSTLARNTSTFCYFGGSAYPSMPDQTQQTLQDLTKAFVDI